MQPSTLVSLRQGKRRVSDFGIQFRTLAADSGWNQSALIDPFLHGLGSSMKDHSLDIHDDLDSLISLGIKIDKRLAEREKERSRSSFDTPGFFKFC